MMFETLAVLLLVGSNAYRVTRDSHFSNFHTSPHMFNEKVMQDFNIECMTSGTYYLLTILAIFPLSAFISAKVKTPCCSSIS